MNILRTYGKLKISNSIIIKLCNYITFRATFISVNPPPPTPLPNKNV